MNDVIRGRASGTADSAGEAWRTDRSRGPTVKGNPARGRMPSLDGWRAVAIVLVLGSHMVYSSGFPTSYAVYTSFFDGELGVRIFFVLSGFLISILLLREAAETGRVNLRSFFLRRIFRIFPVYFAYLAVLALLTVVGLYSDAASSWIGCLGFCRNVVGRGDSGTVHFWSLAVEEQFYLVWPVGVAGLQLWRRKYLYVTLLLVPILGCPLVRTFLVAQVGAPEWSLRVFGPRSIFMYADSLAVGCLGAWSANRMSGYRPHPIAATLGFPAAASLVFLPSLPPFHSIKTGIASGFVPSIQAWAILACLWLSSSPRCAGFRLLNAKGVVALGVLSYSLYVWHFLFLSAFMGEAFAALPTHDWRVWLIPSATIALLSYRFMELPLLELRKRMRPARVDIRHGAGT